MFLETKDGWVNLRNVSRIVEMTGGRAEFVFNDGAVKITSLAPCDFARIMGTVATVPAAPGYYILESGGTVETVSKDPVVAWQVHDGFACPVGVDVHLNEDHVAVLCPDGRVVISCEGEFDDVEAWVRYEVEEGEKK